MLSHIDQRPNPPEYRILFLGDIVGKPGRRAVERGLPRLVQAHRPLFVIANGENAAAGIGITPALAEDLFRYGIDAITLGNHAFHKKEIQSYLDSGRPIVRPLNMPPSVPGRGWVILERDGVRLAVANLCGRVYMDAYDDPFAAADWLVDQTRSAHLLVDFHAEATSEKIAMGWYLDGRASAVVGTHTHVTTADERILPQGTATITDVGMTGPRDSVLGMDRRIVLQRFKTMLPIRFEVAEEPGVISGVVIGVETNTGRARSISRVQYSDSA